MRCRSFGYLQGGSKLERARDLFEQALEKCPAKSCKPLFLMYAQMEEDFGLAKRAMSIFDRATQVVQDEDKFEVCLLFSPTCFQQKFTHPADVCNLHRKGYR